MKFPDFESKAESMYWQDPVFRQIAGEYHECITKREMDLGVSAKINEFYTATIEELEEELLEHLRKAVLWE